MDPVTTPAAPAQPEVVTPPITQSASIAASDKGDFLAFREASRAEKIGKPLPDVAAGAPVIAAKEPVVTPQQTEDRQLSKRQQETNDRVREAVSRATADKDAEIARLRAQLPKEPVTPTAAPKPTTEPSYKQYLALPDAPKLDQFDDLNAHAAAMAAFITEKMLAAQATATTRHAQQQREQEASAAIVTAYQQRMTEAGGPAHFEKLSPEVRALSPVEYFQWEANEARLNGDEPAAQAFLAKIGPLETLQSCILKSAIAPQLQTYLSAHPDELERFRALRSVGDVYRSFGHLEARVEALTPTSQPAKTLTSAPPPPLTFAARPAAPADPSLAALNTGDFRAFRAAEAAKRTA